MLKIIQRLKICVIAIGLFFLLQSQTFKPVSNIIDLSGNWAFQMDEFDKGITERWFLKELNDEIILPGSMLTNGKGNEITLNTAWTGSIWDSIWYRSPEFEKYRQPDNLKVAFWLQPDKHFIGVAWYQKKNNRAR
jgi:hypothetical protein